MKGVHKIRVEDAKPPTKLQMWWWHNYYRIPGYRWMKANYWRIYRFFVPARPRLLKVIGRDWRDLTWLIPEFLFESIIDFVESEKCFKHIVWLPEEDALLRDLYDYAKVRRPAAKDQISKSLDDWFNASTWAKSLTQETSDPAAVRSEEEERLFNLHNELEAKFEAEELVYMHKIVEFHRRLWT